LSILGAMLAALASQMGARNPGAATALVDDPRAWVAIAAAICLAFATFFTQRLLGTDHVTAWIRARAIAEALKREAYKYAAGAAPYDDPDATKKAVLIEQERVKIEQDGEDLLPTLVDGGAGQGSLPRDALTHDEYVQRRVDGQRTGFYQPKAGQYKKIAHRLRATEFGLALLATAITAIASVYGKSAPLFGINFDVAAFTAVLTTIAGAVLAHIEASRYDFLVMTYLATARRLEDRRNGSKDPWSTFVNDCEAIIAAENTSWIAKWTT